MTTPVASTILSTFSITVVRLAGLQCILSSFMNGCIANYSSLTLFCVNSVYFTVSVCVLKLLTAVPDQVVLHSGRALVLMDVIILHRPACTGMCYQLPFTGSSDAGIIMVFNHPPRPTHPGHPCIGEMSTVDGMTTAAEEKRWQVLCNTSGPY